MIVRTSRIVIALLAATSSVAALEPVTTPATVIGAPVTPFEFHGDLRDLPPDPTWRPGDPIREVPRRRYGDAAPLGEPRVRDPLMERSPVTSATGGDFTIDVNRNGQSFNGVQPPDPDGDVGIDYYIQMINTASGSSFVVYDKSDGSIAAGPIATESLGSGDCADGDGDPVVLYDELAGRWMLSEFSAIADSVCVYYSMTGDPVTGGWCGYQFDAPNFPDYPKYAVWPEAIVMTSNEGNAPPVYAFDRPSLSACGVAAPLQRMEVAGLPGFTFEALTPADLDGAAPPAGAPAYIARHRDTEAHGPAGMPAADQIELWELDVDFVTPANTTLTGPQVVAIAEFSSDLCGFTGTSCLNQPGDADLDPLREVIMNRLQYRHIDGNEVLVGNLVTNTDTGNGADDAGVRWFELRRAGGTWSLFQEGTVAVAGENRWMAGTAMDAEGNIAAAYVHSARAAASSDVFPSHEVSGRLANDPTGTMPLGEQTLVAGAGSNPSARYGDYSSLAVDPVDGCTFWWTGEYNPGASWATRISAFRFPTCGAEPLIFSDGFESGDTSAWSSTVP